MGKTNLETKGPKVTRLERDTFATYEKIIVILEDSTEYQRWVS